MKTIVNFYETWVKTVEINIPDNLINNPRSTNHMEVIDYIESLSPDDEIEIDFEFSHVNNFKVFNEDGSLLYNKEY